jgi:hypothetical protein
MADNDLNVNLAITEAVGVFLFQQSHIVLNPIEAVKIVHYYGNKEHQIAFGDLVLCIPDWVPGRRIFPFTVIKAGTEDVQLSEQPVGMLKSSLSSCLSTRQLCRVSPRV